MHELVTDRLALSWPRLGQCVTMLLSRFPHVASLIHAQGATISLVELEELLTPLELAPLVPMRVARACRKRQLQWLGGRLCAELALDRLGGQAVPVPSGSDGQPIWPTEITGSITHNDRHAYAVVAHQSDSCASIGIDSEIVFGGQDAAEVAMVCCTAQERTDWLCSSDSALRATMIFSAKEALYKAAWPTVRRFIDFDAARVVAWDHGLSGLVLRLAESLSSSEHCVTARLHVQDGQVNASVTLNSTDLAKLFTTCR